MNPVTLEAIKLFLEMKKTASAEMKEQLQAMIEKMVFICDKDIDQAYMKYSTVLN